MVLVVLDVYSRNPEVETVSSPAAGNSLPALERILATQASSRFEPVLYTILDAKGSMVTAQRTTDQKLVVTAPSRNCQIHRRKLSKNPVRYLRWNYKPHVILMDQKPLNTLKCPLLKRSLVKLPQVKPAQQTTTTCLAQWNNHPYHYLPTSLAEDKSGNQNDQGLCYGLRTLLWQ